MKHQPAFNAFCKYLIFKKWKLAREIDNPVMVIFFAIFDALLGIFTLINFDETDPNAVITPLCSGCSSLVYYPYHESLKKNPKSVPGLFDVSARKILSMTIYKLQYHLKNL